MGTLRVACAGLDVVNVSGLGPALLRSTFFDKTTLHMISMIGEGADLATDKALSFNDHA